MKKDVVLVFQKNEILGKVKTRLATTVGEARALEIYKCLVQVTYSAVTGIPALVWTCFSEFVPESIPSAVEKCFVQEGQDLGGRMAIAFARSFELGMAKVVLIGTDCPMLQSKHLIQAFEALNHDDLVVGPATDGGYYLIGMKRRADWLFKGITWSTPQVFSETLNLAAQHGLTTSLLPVLEDVDTQEDWDRNKHLLEINF